MFLPVGNLKYKYLLKVNNKDVRRTSIAVAPYLYCLLKIGIS